MPTKYTVSAPDSAAKWCTVLAKSISDNFNSIFAEFRDTKDGISSGGLGLKSHSVICQKGLCYFS